jgi:hypothetical protein
MPWISEIIGAELRRQMFALQAKDGAYLTPHGRMGGISQAALIPIRSLAFEASESWAPVLQKRMGAATRLEPKHLECDQDVRDHGVAGAAVLLARARTKRWASNAAIDPGAVRVAMEEVQSWLNGCTSLSMVQESELNKLLAVAEPLVVDMMERGDLEPGDAASSLRRWLSTEQAALAHEFPAEWLSRSLKDQVLDAVRSDIRAWQRA